MNPEFSFDIHTLSWCSYYRLQFWLLPQYAHAHRDFKKFPDLQYQSWVVSPFPSLWCNVTIQSPTIFQALSFRLNRNNEIVRKILIQDTSSPAQLQGPVLQVPLGATELPWQLVPSEWEFPGGDKFLEGNWCIPSSVTKDCSFATLVKRNFFCIFDNVWKGFTMLMTLYLDKVIS